MTEQKKQKNLVLQKTFYKIIHTNYQKIMLSAREINKAHSTFIDSILNIQLKGRIHADINQIRSDAGGTVTGRFSMSNPNLQQIPARHPELGPLIRSIFIPEQNHKWGHLTTHNKNLEY